MTPAMTNIAFQALSIAVLGVYCWMIHGFGAQAAECLKNVATLTLSPGTDNKRMYGTFLGIAITLGTVATGLGAVKFVAAGLAAGTGTPGSWQWKVAGMTGVAGVEGMPGWVAPAAAIAVAALVAALILAGEGVLRMVGEVTLSRDFTDAISRVRKNSLAAASLVMVPLVTVWTGVNPTRDMVVGYTIAAVVVALVLAFVVHTLAGFVKQKVSVLVWFLYLCTVEIFPVGTLVLAAMKNV